MLVDSYSKRLSAVLEAEGALLTKDSFTGYADLRNQVIVRVLGGWFRSILLVAVSH